MCTRLLARVSAMACFVFKASLTIKFNVHPHHPHHHKKASLLGVQTLHEYLGDTDEAKVIRIYRKAFWHALEASVISMKDGSTFVMTGDVPRMWLRDSAASMAPYIDLFHRRPESLSNDFFEHLNRLIDGFVSLQAEYIVSDPCSAVFEPPTDARRSSKAPKKVYGQEWIRLRTR